MQQTHDHTKTQARKQKHATITTNKHEHTTTHTRLNITHRTKKLNNEHIQTYVTQHVCYAKKTTHTHKHNFNNKTRTSNEHTSV